MIWRVGRHKPYDGQSAVDRIRAAGYQAHSPRQEVRLPGRDDVLRPVFPGYVLVAFDDDAPWGDLLQPTVGLQSILTDTQDRPLALPDGFVDDLMADADTRGIFPYWWPDKKPPTAADRVGKSFKVETGAWFGIIGQCKAANKNKVSLLMSLFGRTNVVEFRLEQVIEVE